MVLRASSGSVDGPLPGDGLSAWAAAATAPHLGHTAAAALHREQVLRSSLSNKDLEALFRGGGDAMGEGTFVGANSASADPARLAAGRRHSEDKAVEAKSPEEPTPTGSLRLPDKVLKKLCSIVTGGGKRDNAGAAASRQDSAGISNGEHADAIPRRAPRSGARLSLDLPGAAKCNKRILLETDRIHQGAAYHMKKSTSSDSLSALNRESLASLQESLARVPASSQAEPSTAATGFSTWKLKRDAEPKQQNALPWLCDSPEVATTSSRKPQSGLPPPCFQSQRSLPVTLAPRIAPRSYSNDGEKAMSNAKPPGSKLGSNKASEELFFRLSRARQTMDFVKRQYQRFGTLDRCELTIFEALAKLDSIYEFEANMLGDNAADTQLTQLEHAFQTAEILRRTYPADDWLHLVGLIHGLGKLLCHEDFGKEPEWSVFGESFPVGCRFSEAIRHHQLFYANPDRRNRQHNSPEGIYTPGCGLHEVNLSWSAAEYLYLVLYLNGTDFPNEALYCIRYQRFDSMIAGAYKNLMSPEDWLWLPWLKKLRAAAVYKVDEPVLKRVRDENCMREMQSYYQGLIEKYIGSRRLYW